jgi:hypothetical protein
MAHFFDGSALFSVLLVIETRRKEADLRADYLDFACGSNSYVHFRAVKKALPSNEGARKCWLSLFALGALTALGSIIAHSYTDARVNLMTAARDGRCQDGQFGPGHIFAPTLW